MRLKILIYLVALVISASFASAWYDYTHQWICDQAGLSQYNCSIADDPTFQKNHTGTSNINHLCINDAPDCKARTQAKKFFLTEPEVSLHLWADSMTPVHWHNFGFEGCHAEFEDCVNSNLKFGNTNWNCTIDCTDLVEQKKYMNTADYNYMLTVVDYVKEQYAMNKRRELAYKAVAAAIAVFAVLFAAFYRKK